VSCRRNASDAAIPSARVRRACSIRSSRRFSPCSSVRPKPSSSASSHFWIEVFRTHYLGYAVGVHAKETGLELERAALLDRAAHDPAQHVAAILVGRDDAVGD
jgi:hypothetical protein